MPSAITIITSLFQCIALLLVFWAIVCRAIGRRETQNALVKIRDTSSKSCMVWPKQPLDEERIFW